MSLESGILLPQPPYYLGYRPVTLGLAWGIVFKKHLLLLKWEMAHVSNGGASDNQDVAVNNLEQCHSVSQKGCVTRAGISVCGFHSRVSWYCL